MIRKITGLLITCSFLCLGITILFLLLPYLCNTFLLPQFLATLPHQTKHLAIQTISPWQIQGTIELGDEKLPKLSIPKFKLSFSPTSLMERKVETLLIDSASIFITMQNGQPVLPEMKSNPQSEGQKGNAPSLFLPVEVKRLVLKNCTIIVSELSDHPHKDQIYNIDTKMDLSFSNKKDGKKLMESIAGSWNTRGDLQLSGEVQAQVIQETLRLHTKVDTPNLSEWNQILSPVANSTATGQGIIELEADITSALEIVDYRARAELSDLRFVTGPLVVENEPDSPAILEIAGNPLQLRYKLTHLKAHQPEIVSFDLEGEVDMKNESVSGEATLLSARTQSGVTLNYNGRRENGASLLTFQAKGAKFLLEDKLEIGPFSFDGAIKDDKGLLTGNLDASVAVITERDLDLAATAISFASNFQFPTSGKEISDTPPSQLKDGFLKIDSLSYKGTRSANLDLHLEQEDDRIAISTVVTSPFLPDSQINCSGNLLSKMEVGLFCHMTPARMVTAELPPFIELPESLSASGTLSADAQFSYKENGLTGSLGVRIRDGEMQNEETILSGIDIAINIPDINRLQSDPSQICTIDSIESGNIRMSNGKILFRIEDSKTLFIEKGSLSWCQGTVETGSISLDTDQDSFETTLYCDRLGFTDLLGQFGITDTEGQGSLNGKLPLRLSQAGLEIDDGFLFSTPGNSGIVRFHDTEQLRQGLPDIEKTPYLDYSMKALENFSYNWTKLTFTTEADTLLLAMQLDGKPATPLPFGYKKGQIVPTQKGPGLQHPIRLDVNFRLPLQDIFQYGRNIQSIMENM